jgi:hypothetical protein
MEGIISFKVVDCTLPDPVDGVGIAIEFLAKPAKIP